jgi:hypothetical protein
MHPLRSTRICIAQLSIPTRHLDLGGFGVEVTSATNEVAG